MNSRTPGERRYGVRSSTSRDVVDAAGGVDHGAEDVDGQVALVKGLVEVGFVLPGGKQEQHAQGLAHRVVLGGILDIVEINAPILDW
jgi:hypothetical protein